MTTALAARAPTAGRKGDGDNGAPFVVGGVGTGEASPTHVRTRDSTLIRLVESAVGGDQRAWRELVQRYTPLVESVLRRYRLSSGDSEDVSQAVWLRLVENLARIREPLALPGWISTTTRNEALRLVVANRRRDQLTDWSDVQGPAVPSEAVVTLDELVRGQRDRLLRDGLEVLSPKNRTLLLLLHAEPQLTYSEIGRLLDIPVGSIGPTRARSLKKMLASKPIRALISAENEQRS